MSGANDQQADPRVITGLWQIADLERDGNLLDTDTAANALLEYANDGFYHFDMADHYGSAELVAGAARRKLLQQYPEHAERLKLFTKWCPTPEQNSYEQVRTGIDQRRQRLGVECIDLLQLHWWSYEHPGYIDVMDNLQKLQREGWIDKIGLTNFDTDHLYLLLSNGYAISSNQVCISVLDRRALGEMSNLCLQSGVKLFAYGTLAGGFLSERWLGKTEPANVDDWSKMKYQRFINAAGGWQTFQNVLATLHSIAQKHQVTIANVATCWVLQQPAVASVIIGARLTRQAHRQDNQRMLQLQLDAEDMQRIDELGETLTTISGDCGVEYRKPPFLTASGDLSDHLDSIPPVYQKTPVPGRKDRWRISSGSEFEPICGYSRGIRDGNRVLISGTTATHGKDRVISQNDPRGQAIYILDKIAASLASLGASMDDVVRTRIYMRDCTDWEVVSRVHGRYFSECLPANTLLEISKLVGPYDLEIEAEAIV